MLYYIDGKVYILAGGYYREVSVKKIQNNYRVAPVLRGKQIEQKHGEIKPSISVEEAYKKMKLISNKEN